MTLLLGLGLLLAGASVIWLSHVLMDDLEPKNKPTHTWNEDDL